LSKATTDVPLISALFKLAYM